MNSNFDLNIKNYTKKELEDIFELPLNYDETTVETQETKMRQNILTDTNIIHSTKNNTLKFISDVKKTLINYIKNKNLSGLETLGKTFKNVYNLDNSLNKSVLIDAGSTNIIKHPNTPYGLSSPSEFYPGTINPLSKRILRKNINIDTRFRENYYTTNPCNFNLDLPLQLNDVVSLQLSAMELPTTFYAISKVFGNNFFVLEISTEPEPLIVVIPDGNYDYLGLQNYINTYLSSLAPSAYSNIQCLTDINTPSGSGPTAGSGRMVFGSISGSQPFSINFLTDRYGNDNRQTPLPLKLGWLMGYRVGYYENALVYPSEGIVNLIGPRYIYLVVDDFNNSVNDGFYGAFTSSILNKNILARISLIGSVFNVLSQNNYNLITTPRQYFGPVNISTLKIQLLDEYGRILDLNNMDYSFCLTFQTVYDL